MNSAHLQLENKGIDEAYRKNRLRSIRFLILLSSALLLAILLSLLAGSYETPVLELIKGTEEITGVPVTAELYKRPKEAPIPELAPYFAWKGQISCCVDVPVGPELFDPNLGQQVKEFFEKLIPLYEYFSKF